MKKFFLAVSALLMIVGNAATGFSDEKSGMTGEELFKEHCALCHPDGANIIYPAKSLRKADLETHGIRTKADIVNKMRHPGKGMTSWSAATLPDSVAEKIADYILTTFQ